MKFLFGVFILVAFLPECEGQHKADSLREQLASHPTEDTIRVNLLNTTGYEYWVINAAEATAYGEQALELAEKLRYAKGAAMAHRVIGVSHWCLGNFYRALTHLFESQMQYKNLGDKLGEANAQMNIGMVYGDQRYFDHALKYYQDALDIFTALGREDRKATTFTKIGTIYIDQEKYEEAHQYLWDALRIHQQNNFEFGVLEVSNRLGMLYSRQGKTAEAEKYLQQSLQLARQRQDYEHVAKNLENLGNLALSMKHYAKAEQYLLAAYPVAEKYGYKKWLRDIAIDLKDLYTVKKNYSAALFYFEKYASLRDSIFNEDKAMQMADLQINHEIKDKERDLRLRQQEIMLLKEKARFDQFIQYVLVGSLFVLVVVSYFVLRNQKFRIRKNLELLESSRKLYRSQQSLAAVELENARLKEQELQKELVFKNKELTSYTMNFIHKNELFEDLKHKLEDLKKQAASPLAKEINALLRLIQGNQSIDKDWEDFKRTFENVHHDFFTHLMQYCPDLSSTELKLCALIRLNLSIKEIASMMGISPESVKTSRYRLRKKLNLDQEQSLTDFMMNVPSEAPASTKTVELV